MRRRKEDLVIVGGGPAGLAAAVSARDEGCGELLVVERAEEPGGILNQCIHNGFGLHTFGEELTGPEYAHRYIMQAQNRKIPCLLNTIVTGIRLEQDKKVLTVMNRSQGIFEIEARGVILAMGCRERPRGALNIPGFRPAGIYSAGTAQRFVNREGRMPGREAVILGSGDIGLIMARRLTLEGARVRAVAELMPYSGGLKRNIVQCLEDFDIPLLLSTTVVDIRGRERVEGVTLAGVDGQRRPIPGTELEIPCDTLLLSCGLIPENELSTGLGVKLNPVTNGPLVNERLETSVPGVFACGNVLHVHDLVDYVSGEAALAGKYAAGYVEETMREQAGGASCVVAGAEGARAAGAVEAAAGEEAGGASPVVAGEEGARAAGAMGAAAGEEAGGASCVVASAEGVRAAGAVGAVEAAAGEEAGGASCVVAGAEGVRSVGAMGAVEAAAGAAVEAARTAAGEAEDTTGEGSRGALPGTASAVGDSVRERPDPISGRGIPIETGAGIRYTVPSLLRPSHMEQKQLLRFRVGKVYRNAYLAVYFDDMCVIKQKKRALAPGEMEQLILKREDVERYPGLHKISVCVEEENPVSAVPASAAAADPLRPGESRRRGEKPAEGYTAAPGGAEELTCICCPLGCALTVIRTADGRVTVTGNTCPRGAEYGVKEVTNPTRTVTSTVRVRGRENHMVSVKTASDIPRGKISEVMAALASVQAVTQVHIGDVILENAADTGVAVVATSESD